MSEVTDIGTRLIERPEIPLEEWLRENPDDFVEGQTLHIRTTGPEQGRAFGYIMPRPGSAKFLNIGSNHGVPVPDSRNFPDNFSVFNRGPIEVSTLSGETTMINGGRLTIKGKHSGDVGIKNISAAIEYLNREGSWKHRADDVGLIGVAKPVEHGPYAGAVQFNGVVAHGVTLRDAEKVNSTCFSPEIWEDPYYDYGQVFVGAVAVNHTAWPHHETPQALAAEASQESFVGVVRSDRDKTGNSIAATAETSAAFSELSGQVDSLTKKLDTFIDDIGFEVAELRIQAGSPAKGIKHANSIVGLEQQVQAITERLEQLDQPKISESEAEKVAS